MPEFLRPFRQKEHLKKLPAIASLGLLLFAAGSAPVNTEQKPIASPLPYPHQLTAAESQRLTDLVTGQTIIPPIDIDFLGLKATIQGIYIPPEVQVFNATIGNTNRANCTADFVLNTAPHHWDYYTFNNLCVTLPPPTSEVYVYMKQNKPVAIVDSTESTNPNTPNVMNGPSIYMYDPPR